MFQTKVVGKIKTHILCSVTFFRKSCCLWDNVEKYCRAGQTTDDNMAHEHCMLDTWEYKSTLRICNTYCLSTATVGTRIRNNILCILRVLLNTGIATVKSVAFSKAPVAYLHAHFVTCLKTGAERCGVYVGVTDRMCCRYPDSITFPVLLQVYSSLFTIWWLSFGSLRRVVDEYFDIPEEITSVHLLLPQCWP